MGYYNFSPNYKLSTCTISKSLLASTRFNQCISRESGSTTCYSAFPSVSQPQPLSFLLLLQPQWQACICVDCVRVYRQYDAFRGSKGWTTWYVWRVSIRAWGATFEWGVCRLIMFSHFDFLSAPFLSRSLHLRSPWECAGSLLMPPLCRIWMWDSLCLQHPQKGHLLAVTSEHPEKPNAECPHPETRKRGDQLTERTDSVACHRHTNPSCLMHGREQE